MKSNAILGASLGQLLADSATGGARNRGVMAAQKHFTGINKDKSIIAKNDADTAQTKQITQLGSDDGLVETLLQSVGANSEQGRADFNATLQGNYQPPTQPLAFTNGGEQLPVPGYTEHFPALMQKMATLKQQLAIGDKNIAHTSEAIRGDQRNAVTGNVDINDPSNLGNIARATAAIDGNNPETVVNAGLVQDIAGGEESENFDLTKALFAAKGKGIFDNLGDSGTFNVLTGDDQLNDIGTSVAGKNDAQAFQANAAGKENLADAALAAIKGKDIQSGGTGTSGGSGGSKNKFTVDSSYQSALGEVALDKNGNPMYDPFSGAQKVNRNIAEETNFLKWANENNYKTTDSALGDYLGQGRPRAKAGASGGSSTPNNNPVSSPEKAAKANAIKQQLKDKKITRAQAIKELQKLGFE